MRTPLRLVRVSGQSMTPTLLDGDVILVVTSGRGCGAVTVDDVVLARFVAMPDLLVVKRVSKILVGGALLGSDNPAAGTDSRTYGRAEVLGVASWMVRLGKPLARRGWRRFIPQRIAADPPIG